MMMSPSKNKGIHVNYSTPPNKDPPKDETTAVIAVMRGNPKMVTTAAAETSTISKKWCGSC
jgi:hypothetical protein